MTPLPIVVPDASVLLKWVLPAEDESDTDRALLLRAAIVEDRVRALVPALWLYEVGNSAARRFPVHAAQWMSAMMRFGLEEAQPSERWLLTALEITASCDATFYDAAYHAVALVNDGVFVTADSRYVTLARKHGAIVALRDWQAPETGRRHRGRR